MSGEYITIGLRTDPDELHQAMVRDYQARVPGWAASPSDPLYVMLGIQAYRHAVLLDVGSQVADSIFRTEGRTLFGVNPDEATRAVGDATFTVRDTNGPYLIPAGTRLDIGPFQVRFTVTDDVIVPNGVTTTNAGEVRVVAEDPGLQGTGLTGPVVLADPIDAVTSAVLVSPTVAGRDAEPQIDYMDRLTRRARRLSPKFVTIEDVTEGILDLPGVGATLGIDNYVPAGPGGTPAAQTNVAGATTIYARSPAGDDLAGDVRDAVLDEIARARLDDVVIYLADGTRTTVGVVWTGTANPDADTDIVEAAGNAALTAYLASGSWGLRGEAGQQRWRETLAVRYGELYAILNAVPDLDTVDSIEIGGEPPDTDLVLDGPAAITVPGTMTGTVSSP